MSREVKFRAKVLNTNNWIYRQPFHIRGTWYMYNQLWDMVPIEHKTIGQFTSLKDKNGVEIYEGDILAFEDDKFLWLVEYDLCCFVANGGEFNQKEELIEFYDWKNETLDIVIVGNIYEHPHLLEVAQ